MDIQIRNAVPEDAKAIQIISAAGYKRSFAGIHSAEYLNKKLAEYLSDSRREKIIKTICDKNQINIVITTQNNTIVGHLWGRKDDNNIWQLVALYVDDTVIGDIKFALSLVKEFSKRIKQDGADKFTTGTLTGSRVCKLYELLGGKKIKEFINEKRDNVSETEFEFDVNRFL
ncbi:MAG: hypothetical protein IJL05_04435 [Alphaproteobacteria bacterium]|nr:hypothetical protein [Alphaproteobacteria bacterium]